MSTATMAAPQLIVDLNDASVVNTIKKALKLMHGVEKVSVKKAKTPKMSELVSPSCDTWWDDPENVKMVDEGIAQAERGECIRLSMDEIRERLGL